MRRRTGEAGLTAGRAGREDARSSIRRDELAALEAEHPGHRLWREISETGPRYHGRSRNLAAHPYAVVTRSLAGLAAALAAALAAGRHA